MHTCSVKENELFVNNIVFLVVNSEVLFMSRCGKTLTREQLHDLGEEYVETYMLDVWGEVMNYMEEFKSNDSPLRMFLPTYVVVRLFVIYILFLRIAYMLIICNKM